LLFVPAKAMTTAPLQWIASYPRSGNTFLRTIIFHCFGIRTASIYPRDLGEGGVAEMVGHIEHGAKRTIDFGDEPIRLIKTHHPPQDDRPAIYIVRDGREATSSLYAFSKGKRPISEIIEGKNGFGTWAEHLRAWDPRTRPGTLFLRYEDVVSDTHRTIDQLAGHLRLTPKSYRVPSREEMAQVDGKWVRSGGSEHAAFTAEETELFWQVNGDAMRQYGYSR
jgi:hypothetical protein